MIHKTSGLLLALSLVLVAGCSNQSPRAIEWLPGERTITHASPAYNLSNPNLVAADSDYVLVVRVEKYVRTRYPDSKLVPQTDYDVTILEVIKGNLEAGQKIPITKNGGIAKNRGYYGFYYNDDFMPEVGEVYVFLVSVDPDGKTLSVMGPHGTVPLESSIVADLNSIEKSKGLNKQELISKSLQKSEVFAKYVAAAENRDTDKKVPSFIRDRERHKSIYEK